MLGELAVNDVDDCCKKEISRKDRYFSFLVLSLIIVRPVLSLIVKPELLDKSTLYMTFIALGLPASALCNFGAAILRSLGYSTGPMLASVICVVAIRSTWIFGFFPMRPDTVAWLYLCYPIAWIATILADVGIFVYAYKMKIKIWIRRTSDPWRNAFTAKVRRYILKKEI